MAFLIGLECAGDWSCVFLLQLVQWGEVFGTFHVIIFVKFKYYNHSAKIAVLYGHRLLWTMDTFLCPKSQTLIYCQPCFTDTGYLHIVYFHCNQKFKSEKELFD